jgi:hypothetical protein
MQNRPLVRIVEPERVIVALVKKPEAGRECQVVGVARYAVKAFHHVYL